MLYSYRAVDRFGKATPGEREAGSERELADALRHDGLLLLDAQSRGRESGRFAFLRNVLLLFGRVSLVERMGFARNLAVMIGAGLPLTRSLEALEQQSQNSSFQRMLAAIRAAVLRGESFAAALRPHERIFGALFINMVEAGEVGGNLERVLITLTKQMKRDYDIRARVRSAMTYPAIVLAAMVFIGLMMMVYVVPTLTKTFQELEIELPVTTRAIIGGSNFITAHYLVLVGGILIALPALFRLRRVPRVRRDLDRLMLRLPVFGALVQKLNSGRFARTLSSLLTSGVPIVRALEITAAVLGNIHFREALLTASQAVQHGKPLAEILRGYPTLFPPLVTQMVAVGEETGTSSRMLLRIALFYEEEVTTATKNLSNVIEPILMLVIGAAVGFFAISMIQPIYSGLGNL